MRPCAIYTASQAYSTRYEPMATILPAFWLLYRRMGAAGRSAGDLCDGTFYSLILHWSICCFRFISKAQTDMIRSHCLYHEYYYWMIFVLPHQRGQQVLRVFDPKCQLIFLMLGRLKKQIARQPQIARHRQTARHRQIIRPKRPPFFSSAQSPQPFFTVHQEPFVAASLCLEPVKEMPLDKAQGRGSDG